MAEERDDAQVTSVDVRAPRVMRASRALKLCRYDSRRDRECPVCGAIKLVGRYRCVRCRGLHITDGAVAAHTSFEQDEGALAFVDENVGGASLQEVGAALGVTCERVRQIEATALRKLRDGLLRQGLSARDIGEVFAQRVSPGEHTISGQHHAQGERVIEQNRLDRAARETALNEPSEWLRRLNEQLDEVHAIGLLACHAANLAEYGA